MKLLEDVVLTHSIEIKTTPERVFDFFRKLDDAGYRVWHPQDHVSFRWIKGEPWEEGSVLYAEEYLHGKLHKLKLQVTKVVPNRKIEFAPLSRLLRIYFPKNTFEVEPKGDTCVFTTSGHMRVGRLVKTLAKRKLEHALASASKHIQEEGENLKRILENDTVRDQDT
jgi:uncharacterized protein YndB with AHSA1/START domain